MPKPSMIGSIGANPGHCRRLRVPVSFAGRRHAVMAVPWLPPLTLGRSSRAWSGYGPCCWSPERPYRLAWAEDWRKARPEGYGRPPARFQGRLCAALRTAFHRRHWGKAVRASCSAPYSISRSLMGGGTAAPPTRAPPCSQPHRFHWQRPGGCRKTTSNRIQPWDRAHPHGARPVNISGGQIVRGLWADAEKILARGPDEPALLPAGQNIRPGRADPD